MSQSGFRVLVTGANGFIGKNLIVRLGELNRFEISTFLREDDYADLRAKVSQADAVVHLAGENRPQDDRAFAAVNTGLTVALCDAVRASGRNIPLILASSTQAAGENAYGKSKLAAEEAVRSLSQTTGCPALIYRFPGVFGKWCKPNYNSVVATFCHNLARGLPIQIHNAGTSLTLAYVDDVVSSLIASLDAPIVGISEGAVTPQYSITIGELADQIRAFGACRTTLVSERVGTGLARALYATYVSYLPNERFAYDVPQYADTRGVFVEMLKTHDSGQFSYFTAHPGVTRGGHYHHTKTEKFLVIRGNALFRFRHLLTNEVFELNTSGDQPQVVETIPGWVHDITNVGSDEMVVMLWANENFDRERPDTVAARVAT